MAITSSSSSPTDAPGAEVDAATFQAILQIGRRGDITPKGLTLGRLRDDDALEKIGLREGDLITKLNGHAMTEPGQIVDATVAVMKARVFDAEVLRAGKPIRVVVRSPSWKPPSEP